MKGSGVHPHGKEHRRAKWGRNRSRDSKRGGFPEGVVAGSLRSYLFIPEEILIRAKKRSRIAVG